MDPSLPIFATSAIAVGFVHTAMGFDHTLPFIVLGRAQGWSLWKVLRLTLLCGLAHVVSSLVLGLLGVGLGISAQRYGVFQEIQGHLAAWSLILFGLTYAGWSFAKSRRRQRHLHDHGDGHLHVHEPETTHGAFKSSGPQRLITTWSLFIIFALGPCEPLIPLIMVPALKVGMGTAMQVAGVFSFTTIGTMVALVSVGYYGVSLLPLQRLQVHANTLAGLAVAASGLAIQLFGI